MKTKLSIALIVTVLFGLSACQPSAKKENPAIGRAETQLNDFRNSLDEISEDDPGFANKLRSELSDFNEVMDTLERNLGQKGDTAEFRIKNTISEIRQETAELNRKLGVWSGQAHDSIDSLGTEIKVDFRELKTGLAREDSGRK